MAVIRTHNSTVLAPTVSTNGTQYVDGALNISAAVTIVLSEAVYTSGGYYVLFDWSGGGSFSGTIGNLTVTALKSGLTAGTPYIDGSTIKVRLLRS